MNIFKKKKLPLSPVGPISPKTPLSPVGPDDFNLKKYRLFVK